MPTPALASSRSASSTAVRTSDGSASSCSQRLRSASSIADHLGDHVRGGLVPGDQQADAGGHEQRVGPALAVSTEAVGVGDQRAEDVLARLGALGRDVAAHVAAELLLGVVELGLGVAGHAEHDVGPVGEPVPIGVRHAEHVADHPHRQREGERGLQVGRGALVDHVVDQLLGHRRDARSQRVHPLGGEPLADHATPLQVGLAVLRDDVRELAVEHPAGLGVRDPRRGIARRYRRVNRGSVSTAFTSS